jgi:hypothetical protein
MTTDDYARESAVNQHPRLQIPALTAVGSDLRVETRSKPDRPMLAV